MKPVKNEKKIFLSYAHKDKAIADQVYVELNDKGYRVFWDRDIRPGESWQDAIQENINSSDVVIVLLSDSFLKNSESFELSRAFSDTCKKRNINTFCLNIDEKYASLKNKSLKYLPANDIQSFDFFKDSDLRPLLQRIDTTDEVSWDNLTPMKFEKLVGELLEKFQFENIIRNLNYFGRQCDYIADYYSTDPFGDEEKTTWIVECKFYKNSRFSISALHEIIAFGNSIQDKSIGLLLITNSQFTSASIDFLRTAKEKYHIKIKTLDGFQLRNLIAKDPQLVTKFFAL
jgi:hypothetical protein